jgi:Protein of unknown function (DUF2569)
LFCARCGQQIPDATEICPLCGREAFIRLDPPPAAPAALPQIQSPSLALPMVQDPSGVGGWLFFYCLTLTVLVPAYVLIDFSSRPYRYANPDNLINVARIIYGVVVGISLWTRRRSSLLLLKVNFILIAALLGLYSLSMIASALREHSSVFQAPQFSVIAYSAGFTLLWFAYFRKSARVRNTYGANL